MSRFLKFIVNLVVLAAIVIAAALIVPPFVGINTVMNDNTEVDTNIPAGYVAYGQPVGANKLKAGDRIITKEGASTYIYEIADMDASAGTYKVKDAYDKSRDEEELTLAGAPSKVLVVIPFIGYAAMALQSKEGLIVVGLGIVLLIILFILSEVFRKDDDDDDEYDEDEDEDEDDNEDGEDDDDEEDDEEEEKLSRKERRRLKKEEKRRRKMAKKGYDEDEDEDDDEYEYASASEPETSVKAEEPAGYDDAMKEAISSIAMEVAKVSAPEQVPDATVTMPDVQEVEKLAAGAGEIRMPEISAEPEIQVQTEIYKTEEETEETSEPAEEPAETEEELFTETEEPVEIQEEDNNIEETPVFDSEAILQPPTVMELLKKAQAAGEEPEVKEDKDNAVTLLDYSDIL